MGIATLAIAGIPPLAGFWSKDEILASLFERGGWFAAIWVIGLVTALITAFYMTRQWVLVFWGRPRWEEGVQPHESPRVMTIPLVLLGVLSVVGGLVNTPFRTSLEHFLEPAFENITLQHVPDSTWLLVVLAGLSVLAGVAGIAAAFLAYNRSSAGWRSFEEGFEPLWGMWEKAYGVDDAYGRFLVAPGRRVAEAMAFSVDLPIVDGAVNGVGRVFRVLGEWARPLQTGYVRNYAALLLAGAIVVVIWMASP
jgi:NADH-quinone oxidoreductase subunit L